MRNTKRRLETLSFYNHTGISAHLKKMAAKGWMIGKIGNTGWIYRRIEPKNVHFAVSYYPKASEFDPEPSEEQKMFHDFCAHTGWQLACTSAQMQIFYNEQENPTPIETEPELEVESIHASAKKGFLPAHIVWLLIAFLNGAMWISSLLGDPIGLLSDSTRLYIGFAYLIMAVLCIVEMGTYFGWYRKAKRAAEQGEFLETPSTSKFQKAVLFIVFVGVIFWALDWIIFGDTLRRWIAIVMGIYMPALLLIVNGTKEFLKKIRAVRGVNRTITILTSFVVSFLMIGIIIYATLYASSHGLLAEKGEKTYEYNGMTWVIHQDELPLTVEDLVEIDCDDYIYEQRGNLSMFLGQIEMNQRARFDAEDYKDIPSLEYTATIVKMPFLYEKCKEILIKDAEYAKWGKVNEYRIEDAAPWGANEAYRLYDLEYGMENEYLLCYDTLIVEIRFDWEPTEPQKQVVAEKLAGYDGK